MIRYALFLGLLAVPGCPSAPAVPDGGDVGDASPDADTASTCSKACKNLAALGCAEGLAADCAATCQHTQTARLTDLHPACLATAKTKPAARACASSVQCP